MINIRRGEHGFGVGERSEVKMPEQCATGAMQSEARKLDLRRTALCKTPNLAIIGSA